MNKKIGDIIFKAVILILLVITIFINNDYDDIKNRKVIKNIELYDKYKNNTYVTFDLSNVIETRFQIDEQESYKTYVVNYNDTSILVVLSPNTVLTSEVNLMSARETNATRDVKESYIKENEGTNFVSGYYTNKDIKKNESFVNYKLIATYIFIGFLILFLIMDVIKIIKDKNNTIEPELDLNNNIL